MSDAATQPAAVHMKHAALASPMRFSISPQPMVSGTFSSVTRVSRLRGFDYGASTDGSRAYGYDQTDEVALREAREVMKDEYVYRAVGPFLRHRAGAVTIGDKTTR